MELISYMNSTIYYKVESKFKIVECDSGKLVTQEVPNHRSESIQPNGVFDALFDVFTEEKKPETKFVLQDDCIVLSDIEVSELVNQYDILRWSIFFLTGIVSFLVIFLMGRFFVSWMFSRNEMDKELLSNSLREDLDTEEHEDVSSDTLGNSNNSNCINHHQTGISKISKLIISYPQQVLGGKTVSPQRKELECVLDNTLDSFLKEVEKLLMSLDIAESKSPTMDNLSRLASPKLSNRATWQKSRQSAPFIFATDQEDDKSSKPVPYKSFYWANFINFSQRMKWNNHDFLDFSASMDNKCRKLCIFYEENCRIKFDQWLLATFTVNYSLFLMEKLLQLIPFYRGIKFEEFAAAGSCRKGHKIISAKQFDILMTFTPTQLKEFDILHSGVSSAISPGQLVITPCRKNVTKGLFKEALLEGKKYYCMSSTEVTETLQEMINKTILLMSTQYKKYFDRLPFSIQACSKNTLQIVIDTRVFRLRGFNVAEIVIRLIPALELPVDGWFQPLTLFATPFRKSVEMMKKGLKVPKNKTHSINPDICWNASYQVVEENYLCGIDKKIRLSGIESCHIILLKILKFLFSKNSKTTLINKGEVESYAIETIVYYLLLESEPQQWRFCELTNRFNDAVLFLKCAVKFGRLPNLFVQNPHLTKLIPFLKTVPFLNGGRADNLFSDMNEETSGKITEFIDQTLKATNLDDCVTDRISTDMWEYEYFLFN